MINVADQPTYFMALKDGEGLVKKFAMVDIKSYQIVAIGDTVAQCQTEYLNLLVNNGIQLPENKEVVVGKKVAGTITKIAPVVLDGNTHYYVVLDGNKDLFEFPIAAIPEIFMYEEGDSISFTYIDGTAPYTVQSIG